MKKPPLSSSEFDQLTPSALNPNGFHGDDEDDETDWPARAIGSGVACVVVFILTFLNIQLAELIFKGHSAELAQNVSYFLIAITIGFGLYCAYASFKTSASKGKTLNRPRD